MAIPVDRNVTKKEPENKLKYTVDVQRYWECGTRHVMTTPVTDGATGTVTKGLNRNLEHSTGSVDTRQLSLEQQT